MTTGQIQFVSIFPNLIFLSFTNRLEATVAMYLSKKEAPREAEDRGAWSAWSVN